jgi:hypothetical protein
VKNDFHERSNQGNNFTLYCLFLNDMMHIATCDAHRKELMDIYTRDFDINGGCLVVMFFGYAGQAIAVFQVDS